MTVFHRTKTVYLPIPLNPLFIKPHPKLIVSLATIQFIIKMVTMSDLINHIKIDTSPTAIYWLTSFRYGFTGR